MTAPDNTVISGTAIDSVAALARAGQVPQVVRIGDHSYWQDDGGLHRVDTHPGQPEPLDFFTLDGFCQYLTAEDALERKPLVSVVSATKVVAISHLYGDDTDRRDVFARALCHAEIKGFGFNNPVPLETLAIALQTCFEPKRGQVEDLRKFTASVRSSKSIGVADDGVSQQVEAKAGIAAVQPVAVNNPWALAPWRTFAEVAQPISTYVLRFSEREAPMAGLYETGNTSWQVEAVRSIATYLRQQLGQDWTVLG